MATLKRVFIQCDRCRRRGDFFSDSKANVRLMAIHESFWSMVGDKDYCGTCTEIRKELKLK